MLVEALFQVVVLFIGYIANHKIGYLVKLLRHLDPYMHPEIVTSSWYNIVMSWLLENGIDINNLPPFKYNHGTDQTLISHEDRNKVIRQDIWQIYTRYKQITPRDPLPSKMLSIRNTSCTSLSYVLLHNQNIYIHSYQMH